MDNIGEPIEPQAATKGAKLRKDGKIDKRSSITSKMNVAKAIASRKAKHETKKANES